MWTGSHEKIPASQSGEIADELESLGFAAMWIPEARGREAFTNATLLLSATSRMTIATGIANIYGRDAVSASSAAKTLNAAFNDRFVLGLGVSHPQLVESLRGHHYLSPLSAMRGYLATMDSVPMEAPEGNERFACVLAALGPKMLELAREMTHGAHTYKVTPEHTAAARTILGDKFIGVEQAVVLTQDRQEFLELAHAHLYNTTLLDNYKNNWRRLGFADEDFVRGGSDRLCEAMVVHGDDSAILARVDEHLQAGADHVCVQVLGGGTGGPPIDVWRELAPALTALG